MRYQLADCFIQENHAWDDLIARHKGEIPQLRHMLGDVLSRKRVVGDDTRAGVDHLCTEMSQHEASMTRIREHLADQQHHLRRLSGHDLSADVDSLSRQNILRERIRHAERAFIDLKCEMLNYLSIIA
jgi:hypothetical protein